MKAQTKTEPRERPIPFTREMVQAILGGRKSQTRRIVKPQPVFHRSPWPDGSWEWQGGNQLLNAEYGAAYVHTGYRALLDLMSPFCPKGKAGDRLWVRETYQHVADAGAGYYVYAADYSDEHRENLKPWKSGRFMPKAAARLWLEITNVRVERIQEISKGEVLAEGIVQFGTDTNYIAGSNEKPELTPQIAFAKLWQKINGKTYPWHSNPFVWVIEFKSSRRLEVPTATASLGNAERKSAHQ